MAAASPIKAEVNDSHPLYLYYFETDDVLLETGQTQAYQFTAFRGEKVTIVVYGLDNLVRPELTLRGEDGETVATGRSNAEQPYVRYIQLTTTQDELFTFDVTAVEAAEGGGLARVMLVEGDPIDGDLTYLDTVNPLLPGRVFMVAGSDDVRFTYFIRSLDHQHRPQRQIQKSRTSNLKSASDVFEFLCGQTH